MRVDYFNLLRRPEYLGDLLQDGENGSIYRLQRITDKGIAEGIRKPLVLAGHDNIEEQNALVQAVQNDLMDRPGDLALVQMALASAWRKRKNYSDNLVHAYSELGGISGALAHEADEVRKSFGLKLEQNQLLAIFARLIRLGDAGGVTRRLANLNEFGELGQTMVEKLTTEECNRLLVAHEDTVEVAHEALITQWDWLHHQITAEGIPQYLRILEKLMDRAAAWQSAEEDKKETPFTSRRRPGTVCRTGR